ncbi:hypothetical protein ACFLIM_18420 [Nonomuraea sp. M3C6]|uniref:Secreted protein n=1 Tax=Nonomuraea marmarensis TaxID=3351344 RepID=A0ABW7ACV9_9ACTN
MAIATAMACGTVVSSGSVAMASATTTTKADLAEHQANTTGSMIHKPSAYQDLDSVGIVLTGDTAPTVFRVSANAGVPWIHDPRNAAGDRWLSLRNVPNSQNGYVINITVTEGDPATAPLAGTPPVAATDALRITARTAAGIYTTQCTVATAAGDINFPATGDFANCASWAALPA